MIGNSLERFSENIILCLTGEQKQTKGLIVKKHSENLKTHGDFSFPNSMKSWHGFAIYDQMAFNQSTSIYEGLNKSPNFIEEESKKWDLPVQKIKQDKGRTYLFLERPCAIRVGLSQALGNNALLSQRLLDRCSTVYLDPQCEKKSDLTSLRTTYVCDVIKNICAIRNLNPSILVTCKSTSKRNDCSVVLCGTVLNTKTGAKETNINANDFIRLRQDEMTLIAQHKYGVRVSTETKWKEFIAHLGESAMAFELLQTKPSSPVKINFDNCAVGSSKGASFILYNCARLETLIRTYNDNVRIGTYPELPKFDEVDFTLLTQEDEWCLIFNYILGLPSLLQMCVDIKDSACDFRPHQLCSFLCSMVRVVSQYYRKIRILVEPRKHLLPVIFARIHMLTMLNNTLKTCLKILNIKSVSQM